MTQINYFQIYSQHENYVTNNTLLLFKLLYQHNKLQTFIDGITEGENLKLHAQFSQQEKGVKSVPDGCIKNDSFKILIETKTNNGVDKNQIEKHLKVFSDEKHKVFIYLTKGDVVESDKNLIEEWLKTKTEIKFFWLNFDGLAKFLEEGKDNYQENLRSIVDDYIFFLRRENLLIAGDCSNIKKQHMLSVTTGYTYIVNKEYSMYYCPQTGGYGLPWDTAGYLGLYTNKAIKAIGKINKIVYYDKEMKLVTARYYDNNSYPLKQDEEKNIKERIDNIIEARSSDFSSPEAAKKELYFFIVDKFYETVFTKTSSGGQQGRKYFDLEKILEKEYNDKKDDVEHIANVMSNKCWESGSVIKDKPS